MNHKDCCCFCFSARTGVMIIGTLLIIGCVFYWIEFAWISYLTASNPDSQVIPYQYVVGGICQLILAIRFCKVLAHEHKEDDWAYRKGFARSFFFIGVILQGILSVIALVTSLLVFKSQCTAEDVDEQACSAAIAAVAYTWSIGLALSIAWNCYLAHVCKLYAAQADPLPTFVSTE